MSIEETLKYLNIKLEPKQLDEIKKGEKSDLLSFEFEGKKFEARCYINNQKLNLEFKTSEKKLEYNLLKFGIANETEKLYSGEIVSKEVDGEKMLFQVDLSTNNLLYCKQSEINIPNLTDNQKDIMYAGKTINLKTNEGNVSYRLDLRQSKGFELSFDPKQESQKLTNDNVKKALITGVLFGMPIIGLYFLLKDINKSDITKYNLNNNDLQKLLDGKRTTVKKINLNGKQIDASLSLKRKDKSITFDIHPVQSTIDNKYQLTDNELNRLKYNEIVNKDKYLYQIDKDSNTILRHPEISSVKNIELSSAQKQALIAGKSIQLNKGGEVISVKIDLRNMGGLDIKDDKHILQQIATSGSEVLDKLSQGEKTRIITDYKLPFIDKYSEDHLAIAKQENLLKLHSLKTFDEKQKIEFDRINPGVVSHIQTDRNRDEFVEYAKAISNNTNSVKLKL